jgi:tetratricopeptide (TPR) repeat protein
MIHQILLAVLLWQSPSFIEQSIVSANDMVAKEPRNPEGYNDLAMAMVRKERESADATLLLAAESAIEKSLKLAPANFGGRRARVAVRLRQHRYEDALEEAQALRKERPDDNPLYGYISEAEIALGNYLEAEKAVQRMLDLRSVNGPGFEYGAVVRELIGYPEGAIQWWDSALHLVSDRDQEERAFICSQMARVYRETGKYDSGAQAAQQALQLRPGYPAALFELARIRIDQRQPQAAVELLRARMKEGKDLASRYWLGVAQEASGDPTAAADTYEIFEKDARAAVTSPDNANALLIRYLADRGKAPDAVAIASEALRRRHDLFTREAYAVALARAGRASEAMEQVREALEPGMLDAKLYFDAAVIARQNKDNAAAAGYFRKAFEVNPNGPISTEILKQLGSSDGNSIPN